MLLGRASPIVPERARTALSDALAPLYLIVDTPLSALRDAAQSVRDVFVLRSENDRLRLENLRLRHWYDVAMALDAENAELKSNLHWVPDPQLSFVTARVVADAGGVYARSVLLSVGPNNDVRKGQIALDANGLVGRVTEVGARSARVLLITDMNSRIPVTLEKTRARAILVGMNAPNPRLLYLQDSAKPEEGEQIVTSAEANAFPAGLPVGTVPPSLSPPAAATRRDTAWIGCLASGPGQACGTSSTSPPATPFPLWPRQACCCCSRRP
jgi:rod shape-determining protein MreC